MRLLETRDRLEIQYDGKTLFVHQLGKPALFLGRADGRFKMHHGHFHIEEDLLEKLPLSRWRVETGVDHGDAGRGADDGEWRFSPLSEPADPPAPPHPSTLPDAGAWHAMELRELVVRFFCVEQAALEVRFSEENKRLIIGFRLLADAGMGFNRMWIRFAAETEEHVYGCGEQFSQFDLRGRTFPLWVSEQGVGRNKSTLATFHADSQMGAGGDYYTTYFPQPTFVSSRKLYIHVADSFYMEFDFRSPVYHQLALWGIPEKIIVGSSPSFAELLGGLTDLLGRQPELPAWAYQGVWLGLQGGVATMLEKVNRGLERGLQIAAVWAQDWEGKRITAFGKQLMWNWRYDEILYPGLEREIANLNARDIRFLGYINPFLAIEGDLYQEAHDKGYTVRTSSGDDYLVVVTTFPAALLDLTNPQAVAWIKQVIRANMIGLGLSGWMADFAEYLPTDAVLASGEDPERLHNAWPVMWARVNREAVREAGKEGEIVFFTRSGYSGTGRYTTLMWAGDQNVDWSLDDGLASVIPAMLSLSMSGVGLHHSDVGGYTSLFSMTRSKELFVRWAELGAFSVVMRTHEGNRPDENWQFDSDEETLQQFARLSRVHKLLAFYLQAAVRENARTGLPVARPLFVHYEADPNCYDIAYEYLLGRDLLVAPVYKEGVATWELYLPPDEWVHLWSGERFAGGTVQVSAELGYPPVFYRPCSVYAADFAIMKDM
ncbi:MAG: alpha-glucosidase [Bacilli bacterium]